MPVLFQIFHFKNNDMQMHKHIIRTAPRYIAKGLLFAIKYKLFFTYLGQYCTQIALINQLFNSYKGLNLFELMTWVQFSKLFVFIADVQPLLQKDIYSRISQSSRKIYIFECNLRFNQRFFLFPKFAIRLMKNMQFEMGLRIHDLRQHDVNVNAKIFKYMCIFSVRFMVSYNLDISNAMLPLK